MDKDTCPLCRDRKSVRWCEKIALGQRTIKEAAIAFDVTEKDIEEHIYEHEPQWGKPADSRAYERGFYVERLESLHSDLQGWADEVMCGAPTPENIRLGIQLTKEVRETLRLLGEVTKILKDDEAQAALAAVKQMQTRYLALTNIIVTSSCPECKAKILKSIEEQKKLIG
jgi:predicted Zn-ribbon and HTH transcriptional regulator